MFFSMMFYCDQIMVLGYDRACRCCTYCNAYWCTFVVLPDPNTMWCGVSFYESHTLTCLMNPTFIDSTMTWTTHVVLWSWSVCLNVLEFLLLEIANLSIIYFLKLVFHSVKLPQHAPLTFLTPRPLCLYISINCFILSAHLLVPA